MTDMVSDADAPRNEEVPDTISEWLVGLNPHARARARRWLDEMIKLGRRGPNSVVGKITPELAAELLLANDGNRSVKETAVTTYAADMASGRWAFNGEPIIVADSGALNDGQHRCHAVLRTGKTFDQVFVFGVDWESRLTTDQGGAKSAGDYLSMEGVVNGNNLAAIANHIIQIEKVGRLYPAARPTKGEVRERVNEDQDIDRSFRSVRHKGANRIAANSVLGCAHYLMAKVDQAAADEFMQHLIEGAELKKRDPILVVREKLLSPLRLTPNEQLKALFMAWNNWRRRVEVRTITHSLGRGERLPVLK